MNPELLVSPVKSRRETDPVGILHLFEGIFNIVLSAAGKDNLLRAPVVIVGTQDALTKAGAFEFFEGVEIGCKYKGQMPIGLGNLGMEDLGDILSRSN